MIQQTDITNTEDRTEILWGAKAIGSVIGLTERQTWHLLEKDELPARRIGGRWAARRGALQDWLWPGKQPKATNLNNLDLTDLEI